MTSDTDAALWALTCEALQKGAPGAPGASLGLITQGHRGASMAGALPALLSAADAPLSPSLRVQRALCPLTAFGVGKGSSGAQLQTHPVLALNNH